MKNNTWLILFLCSVLTSNSQTKAIDSLKLALANEKTDTGQIQKLIYIGDIYWAQKNNTALVYFKDALTRSERIGYRRGEIRARSSMAEFLYYIQTDHATALELFLFNLKVEQETGDTTHIFLGYKTY